MTDEALLWEAAQAVYAAASRDFIATRNQRAQGLKSAGHAPAAAQVAAFRKPSAAADVVNRFVRAEAALVDEVGDLGSRMRSAQDASDPASLRALDRERRELVAHCVERARSQEGDRPATEATLRDVEQTLWAAVVDPEAAAIVRAGVLVRALSPGGFGEVDTSGASAVTVPASRRAEPRTKSRSAKRPDRAATRAAAAQQERARRVAEEALRSAQAAASAAQQDLEAAVRSAQEAEDGLTDLESDRDELRERIAALEHAIRDARGAASESKAALRLAEQQRRAAAAEVDRALRGVDSAQADNR